MSEREAIGKICEKGNHVDFHGEDMACGSHYYATIYLTVEKDRNSMRGGEPPSLGEIAGYIEKAMVDAEAHGWCNEPEERG